MARSNVAPARSSTEIDLWAEMDVPFDALGIDARNVVNRFHAGSGRALIHPDGSPVSEEVKRSTNFITFLGTIQAGIEASLAADAVPGRVVDYSKITVSDPGLNFKNPAPGSSLTGLLLKVGTAPPGSPFHADAEMFILVGGTQGRKVTITNFSGADGRRDYIVKLHFEICDHFGVDESDVVGAFPIRKSVPVPVPLVPPITVTIPHPLACIWVLQHEISGGPGTKHVAFVQTVEADIEIKSTF